MFAERKKQMQKWKQAEDKRIADFKSKVYFLICGSLAMK